MTIARTAFGLAAVAVLALAAPSARADTDTTAPIAEEPPRVEEREVPKEPPVVVEHREYRAGYYEAKVVDPVTRTQVPVAIWYPTDAAEGKLKRGPYVIEASENTDLAEGRFGLVVISHGPGGSPHSQHVFATALARHGFVVAAPLHAGDNFFTGPRIGDPTIMASRARTISAVVDFALKDQVLGKQIDAEQIGILGYSTGATTALQLGGAEASIGAAFQHCKVNYERDAFCRSLPIAGGPGYGPTYGATFGPSYGQGYGPKAQLGNFADPRIRAAFLMAPVAAFFDDKALGHLNLRTVVYAAENDRVLPVEFHAQRIGKAINDPESVVIANKAGHFAFVAPVADYAKPQYAPFSLDPQGFDRAAFQAELSGKIVEFFRGATPPETN
jgi:predicted dienelactone hydrolase